MKRTCPGCGSTVELADDLETRQRVVLDEHTSTSRSLRRYRIMRREGERTIVSRVRPDAPGSYQPEHACDE